MSLGRPVVATGMLHMIQWVPPIRSLSETARLLVSGGRPDHSSRGEMLPPLLVCSFLWQLRVPISRKSPVSENTPAGAASPDASATGALLSGPASALVVPPSTPPLPLEPPVPLVPPVPAEPPEPLDPPEPPLPPMPPLPALPPEPPLPALPPEPPLPALPPEPPLPPSPPSPPSPPLSTGGRFISSAA